MTENQTPGDSPESRGPGRQDAWQQPSANAGNSAGEVRDADDTAASSASASAANQEPGASQSPTERLDQPHSVENPTQQLPGTRPAYPQRQPYPQHQLFYGQSVSDQNNSGQSAHVRARQAVGRATDRSRTR